MTVRRWVRAGLWYLAAASAFPGGWALSAPRSFYDDFPGGPMAGWAGSLPPYNEHFVRDVGAFYLAFAVLFVLAAVRPVPALVRAAGVAGVVATVPHLVFHLAHDEGLSTTDWIVQGAALGGVALVSALVAWGVSGRTGQAPP